MRKLRCQREPSIISRAPLHGQYVESTIPSPPAGVEKDQAQNRRHDAPNHHQGNSGIEEGDKNRPSRDQNAESYDGDDEPGHEFVHGGIVREPGGRFRVLAWGTSVNSAPADLAAELKGLLRSGITSDGLVGCQAILGLELTKAKSASEAAADRAVAAFTLITEAAKGVDHGAYGPAATLLGLAPGTRGSLLKERRRVAAELLYVSPEHLRKEREPMLIEAVADELYAADSAYRLRHRHRTEAEREPEGSGLRIDWLEQHRSYRRIWTPLTGMRNDLAVLRDYLAAEREDREAVADRLCSLTWHWARFELALERFVRDQGGLWLLADRDSEIAAADAIHQLQLNAPLGEADCSWLRTLLLETPHEELDGFSDRLIAAGKRRKELMGVWLAWAGRQEPADCPCGYHAWQRAAGQFIRLIDEDWYRVADWYRLP